MTFQHLHSFTPEMEDAKKAVSRTATELQIGQVSAEIPLLYLISLPPRSFANRNGGSQASKQGDCSQETRTRVSSGDQAMAVVQS